MISKKQKKILAFQYTDYDALICSGAVRSGKTSIMFLSFVDWAMNNFNNHQFAVCGKTVASAIKNIIKPYLNLDYANEKYSLSFSRSENMVTIKNNKRTNVFYIYGGKDERSQDLIQGVTLAGAFLDEVALMPKSFVQQATARCSVEGSKFWFSCNPDSPEHWFYKEWILKAKNKNAYVLEMEIEDNPSLSEKMIKRYKSLYSGVFYDRYILGKWVKAEGLVFANFDKQRTVIDYDISNGEYWISIDYGIVNPFSAGLWCIKGDTAYRIDEYVYDSREIGRQRTDEEHYREVESLAKDKVIQGIIIDPSATSFKETINRHDKFCVYNANNDVLNGISNCITLLNTEHIKIHERCNGLIKEMALYSWDSNSKEDRVLKENDHSCDEFRYFVQTVLRREFDWILRG